jgi:methyl-accepting chemotaxis protein
MRLRLPLPFLAPRPAAPQRAPSARRANALAAARRFADRRLSDLQTLVAIGLLFAVPILLLSFFALREQGRDIERLQGQVKGQAYANAVIGLVTALPLHRDLTSQLLANDASVQAELGRAAAEVTVRIKDIDLMTVTHGDDLELATLWMQLRAQWTLLESEYNTLSVVQNYEAHNRLIAGVNNFLALIAERSGLLLDSESRSYFLSAPQTLGLPAAISQLSGLRLQAHMAGRQVTGTQREIVTRTIAESRTALRSVSAQLDSAYTGDARLRDALHDKSVEALDAAWRLLDRAESAFEAGQAPRVEPARWYAATTEAIGRLQAVHAAISQQNAALLSNRLTALERARLYSQGISAAFVLFALLGMLVLGRNLLASIAQRQEEARSIARQNQRNQEAILRLMDEMAVIADGDLTAEAKVTEDITGAIADSVNVTVSELRKVVASINGASEQIAAATGEAQDISGRLLSAAERQVEDITQADGTVAQMTRSITEVSETASASAEFARSSIETTGRGTRAVQDTIAGMNEIRGQIQDTAKRIKRLGESTQEIGEIVDLISDITEQTNVLALNAAIQAASAGEAGRGFSVVAEEVQRLAERSGEATKQISALVKTIQADTQEAVTAMERSTQQVVEGTQLTDAAGQALQEIEELTTNLAELMQSIAASTKDQVSVAEEVRRIMGEILSITGETTQGTQHTAGSVTRLAALAEELKASVTRFRVA